MSKNTQVLIALYSFIAALIVSNFIFVNVADTAPLRPLARQSSALNNERVIGDYDNLVYGFLPYWMLENEEYIQYDKLTDIAYFGVSINPDGTIKTRTNANTIEPGYRDWRNSTTLDKVFSEAKQHGIRLSLTIISHENDVTTSFLNCEACWETFANNLHDELEYRDISGVNFDFEYEGLVFDQDLKNQYTKFVAYTNTFLKKQDPHTFVVVSTYADSAVKPRLTDIYQLAKVSDKLFIMAYDFHYVRSDRVGPVAPVSGAPQIYSYDLNTMLRDHLRHIPPSSLILGTAYYGYNWVTNDPGVHAQRLEGNDVRGLSTPQNYTNVMKTLKETGARVLWNDASQTPYFVYISPTTHSYRVVHFENAQSLSIKFDLAKKHRLSGVGIWALGYDGEYPELWDLLVE